MKEIPDNFYEFGYLHVRNNVVRIYHSNKCIFETAKEYGANTGDLVTFVGSTFNYKTIQENWWINENNSEIMREE